MNNKQKVSFFSVAAAISAAITAIISGTPSVRAIFIVLPLVVMGIFLFLAGYYAGLSRSNN